MALNLPTLDEIKARVPAAVRATHDSQKVTDALNAGRTRIVEKRVWATDVISALGDTDGTGFLSAVAALAPTSPTDTGTQAKKAAQPFLWAMRALDPTNGRGLDVGNPITRAQIDGLAAKGVITVAQAEALKALAVVPDPVTEYEVRRLVWSDDGRWLAD